MEKREKNQKNLLTKWNVCDSFVIEIHETIHEMMKEMKPISDRIINYYEEKTKKLVKTKTNDFYPF